MKYILLFIRYYVYGFAIATGLYVVMMIYSLIFDDTICFLSCNLFLKVSSTIAVPCGLHLWIIKILDNLEVIKNKRHKLIFKGFASYWIGIIFSILFLCVLKVLGHFVTVPYVEYLTDDNLFLFSVLMGVVVGLFNYKYLMNKL